jgi:hypothetical protein
MHRILALDRTHAIRAASRCQIYMLDITIILAITINYYDLIMY